MAKLRLDQALCLRNLAESRARAQSLIMSGVVLVDDRPITKSGQLIADDAVIRLKGKDHPWVSRGGCKLDHAIQHFGLTLSGMRAIDIGASTGGFTDVLLHYGAAHVTAVDVGHGQLDWRLRQDDRVTVLEKTNARYLTDNDVPDPVDIIVCDASFISLKTILPAPMSLTKAQAACCALIKPQFEAGRQYVGKHGVIREPAIHQSVCDDMTTWMNAQPGWHVTGITPSPITGPKGNKEFLLYAQRLNT